ncbi:MAG: hypothetical protein KC503_16075 [Myxococcales bacterium]|nr:hypothetical protein [Myxococcales bacterium]
MHLLSRCALVTLALLTACSFNTGGVGASDLASGDTSAGDTGLDGPRVESSTPDGAADGPRDGPRDGTPNAEQPALDGRPPDSAPIADSTVDTVSPDSTVDTVAPDGTVDTAPPQDSTVDTTCTPVAEVCNDKSDNDCDGLVDEGFGHLCADLSCTGNGRIKTVSNTCMDDFGSSGSSDKLEIYCCDQTARFCLSKESCPWRNGCVSSTATCSRSGLATDDMAHVTSNSGGCSNSEYKGHRWFRCSPASQAYY